MWQRLNCYWYDILQPQMDTRLTQLILGSIKQLLFLETLVALVFDDNDVGMILIGGLTVVPTTLADHFKQLGARGPSASNRSQSSF